MPAAKRESLSPQASIPGPGLPRAPYPTANDEQDELAPSGQDDDFGGLMDDEVPTLEPEVNEQGETFFRLGETRRLTLREFKGKPLVDVREFYEKDARWLPGKKGCALSPDQWVALKSGPVDELLAETFSDDGDDAWRLAAGGGGGRVEVNGEGERYFGLGGGKRVSLREVKGREVVDVREFYTKDGEEKPGPKGVALALDEWQALLKAPVDLAALPAPPAPKAKAPAPAVAGGKGKEPVQPAADKGKKRKLTDSDDGAALAKFEANDQGERFLRLGNNKRLTVRSFKGKALIDVREYYSKDGEDKPGQKGVSLSVEQWGAICSSAGAVDRLLEGLKK